MVSFFKKLFSKQEQDIWATLIEKSMKEWNFDESAIKKLLNAWDSDKNTFV